MRIGRNEIVEELCEHMRKLGAELGEWCVGTTANAKLQMQDLRENRDKPGLAYREAHTPYAAAEAVEYLVSAFGLQPARHSRPGNLVFVYRPVKCAAPSEGEHLGTGATVGT